MEFRFVPEDLDPHEYCGLVFNLPAEDIPIRVASEIARLGRMELWEYQHFVHHDHPFSEPTDALEGEPQMAEFWVQGLNSRFPEFRFVVEVSPVDRITWYQATSTAPSEDDAEFEDYSPPVTIRKSEILAMLGEARKADDMAGTLANLSKESFRANTPRCGSNGACEHCGSLSGFSQPVLAERHRGMRIMNCLGCGKLVVHSTRTIRYKAGF